MKKIFKKFNNNTILKYSDISNGFSKSQYIKKYNKSNNTILLDSQNFYNIWATELLTDIKTLIIDEEMLKKYVVSINNCAAHNIYIDNHNNLGNITIPFDFIVTNKINIKFVWNIISRMNINKINIEVNDRIIEIECDSIRNIKIYEENNKLLISVEDYNSLILYEINNMGKVRKNFKVRNITKEDIKDDILDLREFNKYDKLYFNTLKFNKLIINKRIIMNLDKYDSIFSSLVFDKLEIIDDNNMKLFPSNLFFLINGGKIRKYKSDYYGWFLYKSKGNKGVIIYVNNNDDVILLDKKYLSNKYNAEEIKFVLETNNNYGEFLIIFKNNNNNYKIIKNDKIYELTDEFKKFLLLNSDIYLTENLINYLKCDDWFNVITTGYIRNRSFLTVYNEYLNYKNRLKKLNNIGLSNNAIKYLYDRKINAIINTKVSDDLVDLKDIKRFEIEYYNKIGEEYVRVKKLKRK